MQCLILAGGLGTRMKALGGDTPKTLIPVAGRPFADHQLSWLAAEGVTRVVYAVGAGGDSVRAFCGDGRRWGLRITYADDGARLLGTAGAIRAAVDAGLLDPGFLVLYGDSYLRADVSTVWAASNDGENSLMTVYANTAGHATMAGAENARVENGRVTLYDKGRTHPRDAGLGHIDYGLSVLTAKAITEHVPSGAVADLADVQGELSRAGELLAFGVTERFFEIGSPAGLAELEAHLASP